MMTHSNDSTRASAYIHNGKLCMMGVTMCDLGPVPFAVSTTIEGDAPNGPVDPDTESENVKKALGQARADAGQAINEGKIKLAAESLVLRARQGDQNAMATLNAIRQQAKAGNDRAKLAFKFAWRFAKGKSRSMFGVEKIKSDNALERAAAIAAFGPCLELNCLYVTLANGPDLATHRKTIFDAVEPAFQRPFMIAYKLCREPHKLTEYAQENLDKDEYNVARVGFIMGRAYILQCVRRGAPVKLMSERAAWELGE